MLVIPDLNKIQLPTDPDERKNLFKWNEKSKMKQYFLEMLQNVLLLPYGNTNPEDEVIPPGMSAYSFGRFKTEIWSGLSLENVSNQSILMFVYRHFYNFIIISYPFRI